MTPLETFLREDRQWPRHLRIEHAKYQMKIAASKDDKSFWRQVLLANTENTLPVERLTSERTKPTVANPRKPNRPSKVPKGLS